MPLTDKSRAGVATRVATRGVVIRRVARERAARRRRTRNGLREVIRSRTHLRELLGDDGFDMRIVRSGAARRRQREFARYALCVLECRLRIRIVPGARG